MRNVPGLLKKGFVSLMALGVVSFNSALVFAAEPVTAGKLTIAQIPTATAIENITLVGIAMISVVIVKYGIKAAKSMIN